MPAQSTNLKDEDIWDLVNYLKALPYMDQASDGKTPSEHGAGS